jgi:hypothetical protein
MGCTTFTTLATLMASLSYLVSVVVVQHVSISRAVTRRAAIEIAVTSLSGKRIHFARTAGLPQCIPRQTEKGDPMTRRNNLSGAGPCGPPLLATPAAFRLLIPQVVDRLVHTDKLADAPKLPASLVESVKVEDV